MKKNRRKFHKVILMGILAAVMFLSLIGCGKEKDQQLEGSYHTEAGGHKRGIDLTVAISGGGITAIVLDDMDSEYSITDPDNFQMMWPAKQTIVMQELQDMGIEGIKEITVELDEQGIPTSVDGFNLEVIPEGCTDCAGMLILAVQDALEQM